DGTEVQSGGLTYTLENITADHTVTVSFRRERFTISGYILEPDGNTPIADVNVEASNGGGLCKTDASGYYELTVDYGWTGTVDPNKPGYIFEPNSISYTDIASNISDNYTAVLETFIISGYVLDEQTLAPLHNVTLLPADGGGAFTSKYYLGGIGITDSQGYYEVLVDYKWSGAVIPSKYAYIFEPNSFQYEEVTENIEDQNYAGKLMTYTITGRVRNVCGVPIAGVAVTAGPGGGSAVTDPNGFYEVWVDYGWSGTITPEKSHYVFDPNSSDYVEVFEDMTNQDYTGINIYDLDCDGIVSLGDLGIFCEHWLLYGSELPGDFYKDEENIINLLDFADFARAWEEL
ncbi:MAG TPA: carboxypeptidase-like regulatory domain-containing protein, partial [Anaerohalosphaeraceae bacterium]|nr:carboxypeptidase-like regulatory domain-containing protein [Anaerohalosphaeraceae bacterium]